MLGRMASRIADDDYDLDAVEGATDKVLNAVKRAEKNKNREDWSPARLTTAHIIEHQIYEVLMAFVIILNIVLIIYETDERAQSGRTSDWVKAATLAFLLLYSVDLCIRFFVYRSRFFSSNWNILDFLVVSFDLTSEALASVFGDMPSISVLRVCRIFRVVRFSRVLRMFRELEIMLSGFLSAMRAMVWASVMLMMTLTIWSIVAVEVLHPVNKRLQEGGAYEGCERCGRAFDSVFASLLTFMQQILAGDSWGQVSLPIIEEEPWTVMVFFAVLVSINLGLLNLILTVIVDVANAARENDDQRKLVEKSKTYKRAKRALLEVCKDLDIDRSGTLTQHELELGMETNLKFSSTMALMDVSKDDMHLIFGVLDEDDSGTVSYKEFVEQLYKVKSQDVHTMLIFIKGYLSEVRGKVTRSLNMLKEELVEVKDLAHQMKQVLSAEASHAQEVLLEVNIGNAENKGSEVIEAFCTCEVKGKPKSRVTTNQATLPSPDFHFHSMVNEYTAGDSLLFSVFGRSDPLEEFRLVAEGMLQGDVLMERDEGYRGPLECACRGNEPATSSWTVKVGASPLWGRNGRESSKSALKRPGMLGAAELDFKQFRQEMQDDLSRVTALLSDKVDSHLASLRVMLPTPPRPPPQPPGEEERKARNPSFSRPCGYIEMGGGRTRV